jgi:MATE family multidrug resistance protein
MTAISPSRETSADRRLWRMAGPIILSNISVPLLGAVDTAVVGHLPEPYYIGAIAIGAMIFNFIYYGFNCLRMGTTGPTAQARGAGNNNEVRAILGRALLLAAIIGAGILVLQLPIAAFAFWAIEASSEVESFGREYFLIRVWAVPAALSTYAMIGWFYGLQDARIPLVLQFLINGLNIVLDFLFVFGFGWGVAGVAAATVIAEYCGLALGVWLVVRRLRQLPAGGDEARILDPPRLKRLVVVNRDIFIRTLCVVVGGAYFMAQSAKLGDVTLAANQVLYNFLLVTSFGLDGLAHSVEALIGEAVGRRDREAFREAVRAVLRWAGLVGLINVGIYWAAGDAIIAVITNIPEVRMAAAEFLPWVVFMPLISIWAYTYDGIFLGATQTRILRNAMIVAFLVYLAGVNLLLPIWGNTGLWAALMAFLGLRGVTLVLAYPRLLRSVG